MRLFTADSQILNADFHDKSFTFNKISESEVLFLIHVLVINESKKIKRILF